MNQTDPRPTSETIAVLERRVSVRKYKPDPIPDATVEAILSAAFRAPTSSNIQAYSVIVVPDPETKVRLSEVAGNQRHVREAPLFLAFCADLTRIEEARRRHGHDIEDNNLELGLVATVDAALVGMSAYLAADSLGIKGVMIGALRNDAVATARILDLPRRVYCVFGMCLGFADEAPPQKPRMAYGQMVHLDRYGNRPDGRDLEAAIGDYDSDLAAHYRGRGLDAQDAAWSGDIDKKFHNKLRDGLRDQLRELGFDFR